MALEYTLATMAVRIGLARTATFTPRLSHSVGGKPERGGQPDVGDLIPAEVLLLNGLIEVMAEDLVRFGRRMP